MRFASILALSLLVASLASAQERIAVLDAPLEATLGDPIAVIVTVTAAVGDEAAVPEQSFEPFEILTGDNLVFDLATAGGLSYFLQTFVGVVYQSMDLRPLIGGQVKPLVKCLPGR